MLNRTNLTLSALPNRLNLGTRSLVLGTGVNNGGNTLRLRRHHHDVMRERMVWYVVSSFQSSKYDIPPMPDSIIPGPQQRPIGCAASQETSRPAIGGRAHAASSAAGSAKAAIAAAAEA